MVSPAFFEGRKHRVCGLGLSIILCFLSLAIERECASATYSHCNISGILYIDFYGKHILELDAELGTIHSNQ